MNLFEYLGRMRHLWIQKKNFININRKKLEGQEIRKYDEKISS